MKKLIVLFCSLIAISSFAQDCVQMIDGDMECDVQVLTVGEDFLLYLNKKGKEKKLDVSTVFSYTKEGGQEEVLYHQDTVDVMNVLTVEQMRMFVAGAKDANGHEIPFVNHLSSSLAGAIGGFGGFWGVFLPVSYSMGANAFKVKYKNVNPDLLDDIFYRAGYAGKVKQRRMKNNLITSVGAYALVYGALMVL